jgi:leucyl aminopeptidase
MQFSTHSTTSFHQIKTSALAVGIYSDGSLTPAADVIDRSSDGALRETLALEFGGKLGEILVLRSLKGIKATRVVMVGLGKPEAYTSQTLFKAQTAFVKQCHAINIADAASTLSLEMTHDTTNTQERALLSARAVIQSLYRYRATLSTQSNDDLPKLKQFQLITTKTSEEAAKLGLKQGQAIGNGMSVAQELGNLPGNICTPTHLAVEAKLLARQFKTIKTSVLERKQVEALKMGSFLSVARGSDEPLRFIVMHFTGSGFKSQTAVPSKKASKSSIKSSSKLSAKASDKNTSQLDYSATGPIVLVGKGITFDSGGISIKPASAMDEMKYDMCGAASVMGTFRALAELNLPLEVVGLIPACENMPNGRANKPGDVVTSMSGLTIEILNTDAEGRLVLCDALTYAERFNPSAVIDIATLTGACVVALGGVNSGLFSSHDELAHQLQEAGKQSQDPTWRLPLDEPYHEQLKSNFADLANIGGPPAGAVTAACFLSRFAKKYPWAHLDIAGVAWRGGKDKGSTGRPVPLLTQYLINQAQQRTA